MSERPVLTLKRRLAAETATPEASGETAPVMRRRKTVVVAAPDPRKQKKQAQKEAEKAVEAERRAAAKEERRRQWLLKNARPVKQPKAPHPSSAPGSSDAGGGCPGNAGRLLAAAVQS
ncbi:TPA: hypothetical protein ACTYSP_004226 [Citrobacter freundii]